MATLAPPPTTAATAPPVDRNDGASWVLAGVASALAQRLGASEGFIRSVLVLAGWFWFWPVLAVYTVAALLIPHAGRRRPGWTNLVGLSRIVVMLVVAQFISVALSSADGSGLFGEGPTVWIPFGGALLAGVVALFTSDRSAASYDDEQCRRIVIGWIPALGLAVAIATGMLLAPAVRWELVLELGLIALGVALAVAGTRGLGGAALLPAAILTLVAILLASSGARLQGGVGDMYARPVNLASVRHEYRRAIGDLKLDLSALRGSGGSASLTASVGIGNLTIDLPDNAEGTVSVRVGAGGSADASAAPPNGFHSGFDVGRVLRVYALGDPGPPPRLLRVRLSAAVGRGCVTIQQGSGDSVSNGTGCL